MTDYQDMSGIWHGAYQYENGDNPVNFTVWFQDTETHLTGNSLEPNTFAPGASEELSAELLGTRSGLAFSLIKTYTTELGFDNGALSYNGQVDPNFASAFGSWSLVGHAFHRGTFQLTRLSQKQFVRAERRLGVNLFTGQ